MAKTIAQTFAHDLPEDEVKRRLDAAIAEARSKYPDALKDAQTSWTGNRLDVHAAAMGSTLTGHIDVMPKTIEVSVTLPFVLSLFEGKIRPRIEEEARTLLK